MCFFGSFLRMHSPFLSLCALAAVAPYLLASPVPGNCASANEADCEKISSLVPPSVPFVKLDAAENSAISIVSDFRGIDGLPGKIISFAGRPLDCSTVSKVWRNEAKRKVVLLSGTHARAFLSALQQSAKFAKSADNWDNFSDCISILVLGDGEFEHNGGLFDLFVINVALVLDILGILKNLEVLEITLHGYELSPHELEFISSRQIQLRTNIDFRSRDSAGEFLQEVALSEQNPDLPNLGNYVRSLVIGNLGPGLI
jgi:hypothetical protein